MHWCVSTVVCSESSHDKVPYMSICCNWAAWWTNTFTLASWCYCQQPLALCRSEKPLLWRLQAFCSSSFSTLPVFLTMESDTRTTAQSFSVSRLGYRTYLLLHLLRTWGVQKHGCHLAGELDLLYETAQHLYETAHLSSRVFPQSHRLWSTIGSLFLCLLGSISLVDLAFNMCNVVCGFSHSHQGVFESRQDPF